MKFSLNSSAFCDNEKIPQIYSSTAGGENIPPPLNWKNIPDGTRSFAILAEDLDAPIIGAITHWIIYNIPGYITGIDDEKLRNSPLAEEIIEGKNIFNKNEYLGPNPPFGVHRYRFTIYALNMKLPRDAKLNKKRLLKTIADNILAKAELSGFYSKSKK